MSYANQAQILELGVTADQIEDIYLDLADDFINGELQIDGFVEAENQVDRLDIGVGNPDWVQLNNCPVIDMISLYDDMLGDLPTLITPADYDLDDAAGVIRLKSSSTSVATFTEGYRTVQATYDYGYSAVPTKVVRLASNIVAKMILMAVEQLEAGSIVQERMGDYMYKVDIGKNITQRFSYINSLMKAVYKDYAKVV